MLHYILQTVAFQIFFLVIYDVFLRNETFFNWNRAYLIITAALSFILPFLKFESIKAMVPQPMIIRLPEVIIGEVSSPIVNDVLMVNAEQISEQAIGFSWTYVWLIGMVLAALALVYKLVRIGMLFHKNPKRWKGNVLMVYLVNSYSAFSFFNYIFLGNNIEADKKEHILQHEMVHIQEKHSLDLLIFEVIRILFWFNPLIYMYQNRLGTLHEFIADAKAVKYKNKSEYYQSLLSQIFETQQISFINPFFNQSLIKKRIIMLSKSKSKRTHLLKYALLIPAVFSMLMYTSSYASKIKDPFPVFQKEGLNQELTFQELVEKYYNEIVPLESKENSRALDRTFFMEENNYIENIQIVAKRQALMQFFTNHINSDKNKEVQLKEYFDKMRYKTYDDYLAYKKTTAAKEQWESHAPMGERRMVVDNVGKLTPTEQKRKDQLMALIDKDNFYTKLHMTDGKITTLLDFAEKGDNNPQVIESMQSDIEVPFAVIDEVPKFPGCENFESNDESKQCTSGQVSQFVNKNFNVNIAKEQNLKGKQRISVMFKIGPDGKIKDVQTRASHPALEAETMRVIKLLPDFIPGKHNGKTVTVPYSLPILFQVQEEEIIETQAINTQSDGLDEGVEVMEATSANKNSLIEVPYGVVEEVPLFPSCETTGSNEARKKCTSEKISGFVNKNFNTELALQLGLKGKQRISVIFKIAVDGSIIDIKAKANHPELEKEAIRVIETLPKLHPGKQRGKPVVVPYSLPILFQVK